MSQPPNSAGADIAVVGLAGRFPGANSPEELWRNVRAGVESIRRLSEEDLLAAGVAAASLADPLYVRACAPLDAMEEFDAPFFGFSPRDASILDPQHRHFLECAWEALESAGHPPERFSGSIGVFAGCGMGAYFAFNLLSNPDLVRSTGLFLLRHTGNDKDFLPTRVSYLLNLTGPSLAIQTACSTSLVAIHVAAQHLLNRECDMALAGGVTIEVPHRVGYQFEPGEILSPDGHCRAFDAKSQGTVFGSGVGVVVLRRLQDAIDDGDEIHAVIKGSAVNNDGGSKVGYLAPSVEGQSGSIAEALAVAGFTADAISYVETHGTGTPVGDPIEVAALTQAFRQTSTRSGFCAIGSLKTNIGHLDTASGVAALIKVVQALKHRELPPSLHFESPNSAIDFARTPFYVNRALQPWPAGEEPRRAGVSSLGVGGTNAHVILEEAPAPPPATANRSCYPLLLSARTPTSLDALTWRYAAHFSRRSRASLADAAYTSAVGRRTFDHRRALVCRTLEDAALQLRAVDPLQIATGRRRERLTLVMMFPGGGAQHPGMATELYRDEPVFREAVDRCLAIVGSLGHDGLRALMFPSAGWSGAGVGRDDIALALERPSISILAVFIIEWALAQLWLSWGLAPAACIGHSLGEYVAACLAEVMAIEDALAIVAKRGEIFERLPAGGMLSVGLTEEAVRSVPGLTDLSIAAVNAPELTVLSGPDAAIERVHQELTRMGVEARRLHIAVAAHSAALDPYLDEFRDFVARLSLKPAIRSFVSNITGTWVDPVEAATADYWTRHLRSTVRFSQGLTTLLADPDCVLLEVGPGQSLSAIARQHRVEGRIPLAVPSLRHPTERDGSDAHVAYGALSRLWTEGVDVDWPRFYASESRRRTTLPTYAFDHERHWIAPGAGLAQDVPQQVADPLSPIPDIGGWTYRWEWSPLPGIHRQPKKRRTFALVAVGSPFSQAIERRLCDNGDTVRLVDPVHADGEAWARAVREVDAVLYCASAGAARPPERGSDDGVAQQLRVSFDAALSLTQALGEHCGDRTVDLVGITVGLSHEGDSISSTAPLQSALAGPLLVAAREYPSWTGRMVDAPLDTARADLSQSDADDWAARLLHELERRDSPSWVRLLPGDVRGRVPEKAPTIPDRSAAYPAFRENGVYLITGGAGGMGLSLARHLARRYRAKLALVSRSTSASVPAEIVRALESDGASVLLVDADVSDRAAVAAALTAAERAFGPLNGVIHAAGVIDDGPLALKTVESARRVLAPKVLGALALHEALGDRPLDFFALCSSTSAELALPGQADYAAANIVLNAFAVWRTRAGHGRTLAIEWGTWRDVGMAARAVSGRLAAPPTDGLHPLLGSRQSRTDDAVVYRAVVDADATWTLSEHRLKASGVRVLPGTAYVELMRACGADLTGSPVVQIDDLTFIAPVEVGAGTSLTLRLTASRSGNQVWDVVVESGGHDGEWDEHARARIRPYAGFADAAPGHLPALRQRMLERIEPGGRRDVKSKQEAHVSFGPRWNVIQELHVGANEAVAMIGLAERFRTDLEQFAAHPALLDFAGAIGLAGSHGYDTCPDLFVPVGYGRIRVGSLATAAWSHARVSPASDTHSIVLDFTVYDAAGRVVADVSQLVMHRVTGSQLASGHMTGEAVAEGAARTPSWLERAVASGIRPEMGALALERVLASLPGPEIVVSASDFHALRAAAAALHNGSGRPLTRPRRATVGSNATAPLTDPIEAAIGEVWQEVLGVGGVGPDDEFLQLGGHSLMAVRVATRLQRRFACQLPLAALLQARTVRSVAAIVRPIVAGQQETTDPAGPKTPAAAPTPLTAVSREAFRVKRASLVGEK